MTSIDITFGGDWEERRVRIDRNIPLLSLFDEFADRENADPASLRFVHKGKLLPAEAATTAADCGINDGDIIHAVAKREPTTASPPGKMVVWVMDEGDHKHFFRCETSVTLAKLFESFANRKEIDISHLRFLYRGTIFRPDSDGDETLGEIGVSEENDIIYAVIEEPHEALLRLIKENDPAVKKLCIGDDAGNGYWPIPRGCSANYFARLGDAIRCNTQLYKLLFKRAEPNLLHNMAFLDGLQRNSSVRDLDLNRRHLTGDGLACELLNCNMNLRYIGLKECIIDGEGIPLLTSAIQRCTHFNHLALISTTGVRQHFSELMAAIQECPHLEQLDLCGNLVADEDLLGRAECEAIAPLLQDPASKLKVLGLSINNIDSDCTNFLAGALAGNKKMERLKLLGQIGDNFSIGDFDLSPFKKLLCDTTSMDATYSSNHTLQHFHTSFDKRTLEELEPFFRLNNSSGDKKEVGIQKILQFHPHFNVEPLFEWDMKVLPILVEWFERARSSYSRIEGELVDSRKLRAIFQFIHAMPGVFEPTPHSKANMVIARCV